MKCPGLWIVLLAMPLTEVLSAAASPPAKPPLTFGDRLTRSAYHDFRGGRLDRQLFDISGKAHWFVKAEPAGLRIALPSNPGQLGHVGVRSRLRLRGDFEVIASYEILRLDKPLPPKPTSAAMLIVPLGETKSHVNIRREVRPSGDEFFTTHYDRPEAEPKDRTRLRKFPTAAKSGNLCVARQDSTVYWLVTDGPEGEFRLLDQFECSSDDTGGIELIVDTSGTQSPCDIRWLDFAVRAQEFIEPPGSLIQTSGHSPVVAVAYSSRGTTLAWYCWAVGATALLASLVLAIWKILRGGRKPEEPARSPE